jgi:hypothetical protein
MYFIFFSMINYEQQIWSNVNWTNLLPDWRDGYWIIPKKSLEYSICWINRMMIFFSFFINLDCKENEKKNPHYPFFNYVWHIDYCLTILMIDWTILNCDPDEPSSWNSSIIPWYINGKCSTDYWARFDESIHVNKI